MTRDGNNARKQAARELAQAEQIPYTEALRRIGTPKTPTVRVTAPIPIVEPDATLVGHTAPVSSVSIHPSGRTLASGSMDGTIRLWDLRTRRTTAVLTADDTIFSAAFSPDGETLAFGGWDGTRPQLSLWAVATGEVATLSGCTGAVRSVVFSPDGRTLASSEVQPREPDGHPPRSGSTVRLWDLASRKDRVLISRTGGYGHGIAFHPGGRTLACSAGMDGTAQLWDLVTGKARVLTGHDGGVEVVSFSPDGGTLASGSVDFTVRLWDVASGRVTKTLNPHGGYVQAVAFSPDGRTLASGSVDPTVRLWDAATGEPTATMFGHADLIGSVAFSPDGRTLATGSSDRTVRLWSVGRPISAP